jgi:small-conductance mechanosensitive channel
LERILGATEWFQQPGARADQGIVFLTGQAESEERKAWAGELARNTQGVVAVVNRMTVAQPSVWDMTPAWVEIRDMIAAATRRLPFVLLALIVLGLTRAATGWAVGLARRLLEPRVANALLRNVVSRIVAVPVFLFGLYAVLRISGLTSLAVTVLGGTGLAGLMVGFAFRDIAENFLASLLISMQNPFAMGDRILVAGYDGFVQSVNARSTVLMTLDGNHVQIPNATIYKSEITNFAANPNTRFDFMVGVGYNDAIEDAQALALGILRGHEAVVDEPESLVLVDSLGAATVNLKVLFWVNTARFSGPKVRSAVIRAVKAAFEEGGVSMPDEAREIVFPDGVPVRTLPPEGPAEPGKRLRPRAREAEETAAQEAEGDFESESAEIEKQARLAREPEEGPNLLGKT